MESPHPEKVNPSFLDYSYNSQKNNLWEWIFHTDQQNCDVDRKISGVMSSTEKNISLSEQFLYQRPSAVYICLFIILPHRYIDLLNSIIASACK